MKPRYGPIQHPTHAPHVFAGTVRLSSKRSSKARSSAASLPCNSPPAQAASKRFSISVLNASASATSIFINPHKMRHDILYALRQIRLHPGPATLVILAFALGIGLNTALFTLVNSILLRAMPGSD